MSIKKKSRPAVVIAIALTMILSIGIAITVAYGMADQSTPVSTEDNSAKAEVNDILLISDDFTFEIPHIAAG